MSNYQEKYKKALKSIQEIIKANKQIKDELDALRIMRQNDVESFANIQKEEFKKAYDALLKQKNTLYISYQTLQLENQKLKYTISELQSQVSLYKNERIHKINEQRQTLLSNQQPQVYPSQHSSPRKSDAKDINTILRQKQAQFHRTIQNYEQHHSNLLRNNKRLEERLGELENKLMSSQKNWRMKYESKQLEVIDIKALTRQEFTEQITILRKENSALKLANNDLSIKLQNSQKNIQFGKNTQKYDWQADLVQEMIHVKANLEPLRQQINQLQELNIYQKQQSIRQRTNLQTRVLELQSQVDRQNETIHTLQRKVMEAHQEHSRFEEKTQQLKKLEQQNQLLNGKIIVMESREIALRNRTGEQLEERVLQFQNRIQLLLNNKEGLRQLRQVGIHQLLALKAYILQLDSKLKQLLLSNNYLLKKYKSYKQKYQNALKQHKQYGMTINTLKMKMLGYDKLVVKLQSELQRVIKSNQIDYTHNIPKPAQDNQIEIYRKKYELMKQKLQIQQKYKEQEMQTFKLNYQTRIMELTIKVQEMKSLKQTIDLYRNKNEELQTALSKKQTEIFQSKILSNSKGPSQSEVNLSNKQTKEIINNLHANLKQNDQTIFRLQTDLRNKQDNYKRSITKLQRQLTDLRQQHARQVSKLQMDHNITLDQEIKKYKLKINDLEHNQHFVTMTHKDEISKKYQEAENKIRKLQSRLQEAESKRQEQVFNRRRLQKQIMDLNHDKEELQRASNDLNLRITQYKSQQRELEQLKIKLVTLQQDSKDNYLDYELQSKDTIIKKLNNEILQLKSALGGLGQKDITVSSQKNEIYYLKKQIQQLNDTINKYNNEIIFLKGTLDNNKNTYNNEFTNILQQKQIMISKLRRDFSLKENKIHEYQQQISKQEELIRKLKRDVNDMDRIKQDKQRLQQQIIEKDRMIQKLKSIQFNYEEQIQRINKQLTYLKDNYQRVNYQLLQKNDQISKLNLEINSIAIRSKQQIQNKYVEQILQKERLYNKQMSQLQTLRSNLMMIQQDCNYHEENYKRANNQIFNLRGQINHIQQQNDELNNQIYFKTQQINKLQYNIESYQHQIQQLTQRDEDNYRVRTQIFSLKSDVSNLQEEVFSKQAVNARLSNQINYIRSQFAEMQQQLQSKQQYLNKMSYEYNLLKGNQDEAQLILDEKDKVSLRLSNELNSIRNKYRELQQQMQERQQQFSLVNQQLNKFKVNLTYYEQQIDEKNLQITKLNNEKQLLKSQIYRLNEYMNQKNQQINRIKQQIFSLRLTASQKDYNDKMIIDQEIYSLKSKINQLEHQLEDKDSEIRRMYIEFDTLKSQPLPQPLVTQDELQQLRNQLAKKQREIINYRFDLQDKQYQLQTIVNSTNLLKNTLADYQQRLITQRQENQLIIREIGQRERKLQQQISYLNQELERKNYQISIPKSTHYQSTYTQQEMNEVREQYNLKQRQLNAIKYELQDKLYVLQTIQSKAKIQQKLLQQIQQQYNQDRQRYQAQIQQYIIHQRQYNKNISEMQQYYQQQIRNIKSQVVTNTIVYQPAADASSYDQGLLIKTYIQQIDRLNKIVKQLQQDIQTFKLKLSSMINQQNRIQQNLITMVLLFTQIQSIRDRLKSKQVQIGQVRKSFIQMTVSGQVQANKLSRLIGMAKNNTNSQEQIQVESADRQSVQVYEQIQQLQEHLQKSRQPELIEQAKFEKNINKIEIHSSESQQEQYHEEQQAEEIPIQQQQQKLEIKQQINQESNQIKESLIQQLQRQDNSVSNSQVRSGQITIKIQNTNQYLANSRNYQSPAVYQPQVIQGSPQYIQTVSHGQQQVRIIQQGGAQSFLVNQSGQVAPPYIHGQPVIIQNQNQIITGAIPQHQIIRPVNYFNIASPSVQYRPL